MFNPGSLSEVQMKPFSVECCRKQVFLLTPVMLSLGTVITAKAYFRFLVYPVYIYINAISSLQFSFAAATKLHH